MVIDEIIRQLNFRGAAFEPYYYRTSAGAEVDLIVEGDFGLIPFEIKHSSGVERRGLRALKDFVSERGCPFGVVVSNDSRPRLIDESILGVPFSYL